MRSASGDRGISDREACGGGMAPWSATPESLERIGLGVRAAIEDGPEAPGRRSVLLEALRRGLEACSRALGEGLQAAGVPAEETGGESQMTERVLAAGDRLILIVQEVALADEGDRWASLERRLAEKNFLRSWSAGTWTAGGAVDLAGMLERALAGTGFGCDVRISTSLLDALGTRGSGRAALVSCRPSACLALTNFVERTPGFRAESFARVTADGRVEVACEAQIGASRPEVAHPISQRSG